MKQFLLSVLVISLSWGSIAYADTRLIVVGGVAEKSLDPNLVRMSIEVWGKAPTAKQAQGLAASEFKLVKKTFDEFKLKKEDIQTDNYALNPEYIYDQKTSQNKLSGYRVTQTLYVTLRKVEETGNFIDALIAPKKNNNAGVNVNNITWDSDKRAQVETAALGDAVRAARLKADEIAKAAGVTIKGVAKISHAIPPSGPVPMGRTFSMKAMAESASTEVAAGQVKVQVEVTAEYEIN